MTLQEVITSIRAEERGITNLYVESEASELFLLPGKTAWEPGIRSYSGRIWIGGANTSKVKVDQTTRYPAGPAPAGSVPITAFDDVSTHSYDGHRNIWIQHETGPAGKMFKAHRVEISAEPPFYITLWLDLLGMGLASSIYFLDPEEFRERNPPVSESLRQLEQLLQVFDDVKDGVPCLRVSARNEKVGVGEAWWFDPSRGWAMLGFERTERNADGSWRTSCDHTILTLVESSPGIWYPTKATYESDDVRQPGKRFRYSYNAKVVITNDPEFDESVFTLAIPAGYCVYDKVAGGIVYTA